MTFSRRVELNINSSHFSINLYHYSISDQKVDFQDFKRFHRNFVCKAHRSENTLEIVAEGLSEGQKEDMFGYLEDYVLDVRLRKSRSHHLNILQHTLKMAKKRGKEIRTRVNPDEPFDVTWSIPIVEEKFTIVFISVI